MVNRNHGKTALVYILVYLACLSAFLLLGNRICLSQSSEQVTITTYYPAPYGVYTELRARRMGIGPTYFNPVTHPINNGIMIVENTIGIGTDNPVGKFDVRMNNANDYFRINNDSNIGLVLRSGTGGRPFIGFSNDAATTYDIEIRMQGDDTLNMVGAVTRFTNNDGTSPAIIRVGEVWFCLNYADAFP